MNFRIGQKVVCIDDSPATMSGERHLVKGRVYEIEGFTAIGGLHLAGVPRTDRHSWGEHRGWSPRRFRPIAERKTDISTFTEILDRANKRERVSIDD